MNYDDEYTKTEPTIHPGREAAERFFDRKDEVEELECRKRDLEKALGEARTRLSKECKELLNHVQSLEDAVKQEFGKGVFG